MNCKHKLARFNQKVRSEARLKDLIHPSTIAFIYVVLKYWKEKSVVNVSMLTFSVFFFLNRAKLQEFWLWYPDG